MFKFHLESVLPNLPWILSAQRNAPVFQSYLLRLGSLAHCSNRSTEQY